MWVCVGVEQRTRERWACLLELFHRPCRVFFEIGILGILFLHVLRRESCSYWDENDNTNELKWHTHLIGEMSKKVAVIGIEVKHGQSKVARMIENDQWFDIGDKHITTNIEFLSMNQQGIGNVPMRNRRFFSMIVVAQRTNKQTVERFSSLVSMVFVSFAPIRRSKGISLEDFPSHERDRFLFLGKITSGSLSLPVTVCVSLSRYLDSFHWVCKSRHRQLKRRRRWFPKMFIRRSNLGGRWIALLDRLSRQVWMFQEQIDSKVRIEQSVFALTLKSSHRFVTIARVEVSLWNNLHLGDVCQMKDGQFVSRRDQSELRTLNVIDDLFSIFKSVPIDTLRTLNPFELEVVVLLQLTLKTSCCKNTFNSIRSKKISSDVVHLGHVELTIQNYFLIQCNTWRQVHCRENSLSMSHFAVADAMLSSPLAFDVYTPIKE